MIVRYMLMIEIEMIDDDCEMYGILGKMIDDDHEMYGVLDESERLTFGRQPTWSWRQHLRTMTFSSMRKEDTGFRRERMQSSEV